MSKSSCALCFSVSANFRRSSFTSSGVSWASTSRSTPSRVCRATTAICWGDMLRKRSTALRTWPGSLATFTLAMAWTSRGMPPLEYALVTLTSTMMSRMSMRDTVSSSGVRSAHPCRTTL